MMYGFAVLKPSVGVVVTFFPKPIKIDLLDEIRVPF